MTTVCFVVILFETQSVLLKNRIRFIIMTEQKLCSLCGRSDPSKLPFVIKAHGGRLQSVFLSSGLFTLKFSQ